jgi:hypothetical protein
VFSDGTAKAVEDNPTVADFIAVTQGLLSIYFYKENKFYRLLKYNTDFDWISVPGAKPIQCKEGRIHQ